MLEGVVSRNTIPLLKSSFIDDGKPIWKEVHFLDVKFDEWLFGNPGQALILRSKSVTKKQINKCMAEI